MISPRTLVVGIGSRHGDDQIGWLVADGLCAVAASDVDVRRASTPSHLLDWLEGIDRLIVCDACLGDGECCSEMEVTTRQPGLHRWEWPNLDVTILRSADSHAFGLGQVLQLADRLARLPREVVIFGIEATRFDAFSEVQPELMVRIPELIELIAGELTCSPNLRAGESIRHA